MDVRDQLRHWRLRKNRTAHVLDGVELFSGCTVRQLHMIANLVCPLSITPGRVVVRAGERCNQLIVVIEGVSEHCNPQSGSNLIGPGVLIGEAAIVADSFEAATVTAVTPMELLVASRAELAEIMRIVPAVEQRLRARLASRVPTTDAPPTAASPIVADRREAEIAHALQALRQGVA
jgi:CRP-like cAMP-binding protein